MKQWTFLLGLTAGFALTSGATAAPAQAGETAADATPHADAYYHIVSAHSGRCLDVAGASQADNAYVQQWDCGNDTNQSWRLARVDNDYVNIISRRSGKCLDISTSPKGAGAIAQQFTCGSGQNQQFHFAPASTSGSSTYRIIARHSAMCLEANGGSTENGATIEQSPCDNNALSQKWQTR